MSVYVGIDVHRKRSQVAVVAEDGTVQVNKNVVNGSEPFLRLIGELPSGTPVAFEAAFGWSWLADLLEDYGFEAHLVHPLRCKAIASARLKNDKVDAAILAQLLRADLLPEAWIAPAKVRQLRALLRHRISLVRLGTQLRNRIHAVAADHGYDRSGQLLDRAGPRLAGRAGPAGGIAGDHHRLPGGHRRPGAGDRPDRRRAAPARQDRSQSQDASDAAGRRGVHRTGHGGRDRRHQPVRQRPQTGQLGRADPDRARLGPEGPAREYLQAGLSLAAVGAESGGADRQAVPEFAPAY